MTRPGWTPPRCRSMDAWEIECVQSLIRLQKHRSVYLEIGSYLGGSLLAFGTQMEPGALVVGVDRTEQPEIRESLFGVTDHLGDLGYMARVVFGDSHELYTRKAVMDLLGGDPVDVLLLDGEHATKATEHDLLKYGALVRPGGLILFHDAGLPGDHKSEKTVRRMEGVHAVWRDYSAGKRRMLIQSWRGFGAVWKKGGLA